MSAPADGLQKKFAAFLAWEKRKRWEFMLSWTVLRIPGGTASPFTALATF